MTFQRRTFSVSWGTRRLQLEFGPRALKAEHAVLEGRAPGETAALLPAFVAALVAVSAACFALAHTLNVPFLLRSLLLTLGGAMLLAWSARCAPQPWGRFCRAARWPLAVTLAVCALSLCWREPFASMLEGDPSVQAACFIGFVTVLAVLLIGARSGGRVVPVAAPLVPGLALFGLLFLIAVDARVQASFLLFAGAALYLLCYDRYLRRAVPDLSSGWPLSTAKPPRPRRGDAWAWAMQSVLVSSVWFALFLGTGALLFWPMSALLPLINPPQWNRNETGRAGRALDFTGNAPVMELRGGTHTLSPRVVLRVMARPDAHSGVWRGRVYESYERSLWSERPDLAKFSRRDSRRVAPPFRPVAPRDLDPLHFPTPQLSAAQGHVKIVTEIVEPLGGAANLVYSAGLPLDWRERPQSFNSRDPAHLGEVGKVLMPYEVRSVLTLPNRRALLQAPGLNAKMNGLAPALRANLRQNLELPAEPGTRALLARLARAVRAGALPTGTPEAKVRAVNAFLHERCVYTLEAPAVPPTQDATAFFLTDSRRGACDMFASSMALLLRAMEVPARVATGYLDAGDEASQELSGDGQIVTTVRERDAHAWVEYYVPQFGWLPVDPTENTREIAPTLSQKLWEIFDLSGLRFSPVLLALPLLALALIGAGLLLQKGNKDERPDATERERIEWAYARAVRALKRRVPPAPHLTPGEYEARVGRAAAVPAAAKQEFAALTHLYLAARYGGVPDATREQVEACLARLKDALRRGRDA